MAHNLRSLRQKTTFFFYQSCIMLPRYRHSVHNYYACPYPTLSIPATCGRKHYSYALNPVFFYLFRSAHLIHNYLINLALRTTSPSLALPTDMILYRVSGHIADDILQPDRILLQEQFR
jgi:hypothetical protein